MSMAKLFLSGVKSLHEAIEEGDIEEVKSLLSNLRIDKNYFDVNDVSAAAVAIKWEKHEIYELLVSRGIFLGPHEWMDEATYGQKRSRKENLRDIHRRYFNDPNHKYLINLITRTKLSHEASPSERREHLRLITEAFEDLNGLKSIEPILKVASTSSKLRIVFDFNRDSVGFLDPVKNRDIMGTSYTETSIVYVGAKDLKEKENRCEVLGVLIHELTHFVMKLVYDNESKPYLNGNKEKLDEFSQVVVDTAEKKESEPYIKSVYDYPASRHHAELIVRAPQLTALFKDDENKTIEMQAEFSELFDFYEENTLVDLKREFPLMEVKHEIRELNELFGVLVTLGESGIEMSSQALDGLDLNLLSIDKILFVSSNCPQLTLSAIFQQARAEKNFESSFIFADVKSLKNAKIFVLATKALALSTKPSMIVDCQGLVNFNEVLRIVKWLNENKINQKVILIIDKKFEDSCDPKPLQVVHSWNDLTVTFQQKLLGKKIEFHGTEMVIGELLNDPSSMQSIPFQDLLDDKIIVIGKNPKFETEKLIERKFLPSNSKIKSKENYTIELDLDEFLTVTGEHQTVLISDEPSSSLKMLHSNLREKNPKLWLVFMDLKEYFKVYQVSCLEVRKRMDIVKFFTEKILIIEGFEAEIFTHLFNEDRVVLLMDGLDEICPSYKQFIFSLMKDIQRFSKNQFWISMRPHYLEEMRTELNPIEFSLKPFTTANRREFFEKHFIGDQNFELILKEIESFVEKLTPYYKKVRSVCNPLVLRMIVEILDEDRSLKLSEANLFVIYDRFTRKMIENCNVDKGPEAMKDIANSFGNSNVVEFYQQQAFLTCFDDQENTVLKKKLIDPQFDHVEKPPLDEIVRIGLMFASSSEDLHFIHRTFAEFYVAKFFYELIFKFTNLRAKEHLNAAIEFLLKIVIGSEKFNFIIDLLDSALDRDKKFTVKKFPPSTLTAMQKNMNRKHFEVLVRRGIYNLIKVLVLDLHPDGQTLLFSSKRPNLVLIAVEDHSVDFVKRFFDLLKDLNSDKLKKMLFEQDKYNRNALFIAALNPNSEVFEYIFDFCESFMTSDKLNELLIRTYKFKESPPRVNSNILDSAIEYDRQLDIIIKVLTLKLSPAQQKTMLVKVNSYGSNLLQFAVEYRNSVANFECLFAFIRNVLSPQCIENFLLHKNDDGLSAFDLALLNDDELIFGAMRNFYLEVFEDDYCRKIISDPNKCENYFQESLLYFKHICCSYENICDGIFKRFLHFILEFFAAGRIHKEFFLIKNDEGRTFLEFATENIGEEDFAFLCSLLPTNDRAEILRETNSRGECAFHSAVKRDNSEIFHKIQELYEESFKRETLRQMIVGCDKSWIFDVLECIGKSTLKPSETFALLCHYLSELFKGSDEIERLKQLFLFADEAGQTAFMVAARGKNKEFDHLFAFTKELFNIDAAKEFLLLKDTNGATALAHSFMNVKDTNFESVKIIFEELIGREKVQEFVVAKVENGNILFYNIRHLGAKPDSFEILCNFLITLFEGEAQKIKYFFVSVDHDKTVLMKATEQWRFNCFMVLVNVIEKIFAKEEIVEMLSQRNLEGKTAFHFAIRNREEEIFETVKNFYFKTLGNEAMKIIILAEVDWSSVINKVHLEKSIKRLVPVLKCLFADVAFKNIFFKLYPEKIIKMSMKSKSKELNGSLISYLKEQFQEYEQMKMFIIEIESYVK